MALLARGSVAKTPCLSVPQNVQLREAAHAVKSWAQVLSNELLAAGVSGQKASRLGYFTFGALEGALIHARVRMDKAPILQASQYMKILYAEALETRQNPEKRKVLG